MDFWLDIFTHACLRNVSLRVSVSAAERSDEYRNTCEDYRRKISRLEADIDLLRAKPTDDDKYARARQVWMKKLDIYINFVDEMVVETSMNKTLLMCMP